MRALNLCDFFWIWCSFIAIYIALVVVAVNDSNHHKELRDRQDRLEEELQEAREHVLYLERWTGSVYQSCSCMTQKQQTESREE